MPTPVVVAGDAAAAVIVRRALDPLLNGLARLLAGLRRSKGDGCAPADVRAAAYGRFMAAIADLRADLGILGTARLSPVGAAWTWPVYFRTFWQLPDRCRSLTRAVLQLAVNGHEEVLETAADAGESLVQAIELFPWGVSRGRRANVREEFLAALGRTDEALARLALAARDDLGRQQ